MNSVAETWLVFLMCSLAVPLAVAVGLTVAALALRFGVRLARRVRRWVDDLREPFDTFED